MSKVCLHVHEKTEILEPDNYRKTQWKKKEKKVKKKTSERIDMGKANRLKHGEQRGLISTVNME